MGNERRVGASESTSDIDEDAHGLGERAGAGAGHTVGADHGAVRAERAPLNELHDKGDAPVRVLADAENLDDIRVLQRVQRPQLLKEAPAGMRCGVWPRDISFDSDGCAVPGSPTNGTASSFPQNSLLAVIYP